MKVDSELQAQTGLICVPSETLLKILTCLPVLFFACSSNEPSLLFILDLSVDTSAA